VPLRKWLENATPVPGAPGVLHLDVVPDTWHSCAQDVAARGGRVLAMWADCSRAPTVFAVFAADTIVLLLSLELPNPSATYPSLADLFPACARLQRAAADLCGVRAREFDQRPWLRHTGWPSGYLPLADTGSVNPSTAPVPDEYAFVRVSGEGVHEIPVGPVHAGIIEPGHFRFSVVGEKVLRLEERLGYVHKGIERRFTGLRASDGQRLAARVSGDSAVAFSWAYCQAFEGIAGAIIPGRAAWLRGLALECERVANHLGDLGALGNDAGFAFGLAQFSRLKERWLRALDAAFGQRYLMDFVVPGGVSANPGEPELAALVACAADIAREASELRGIYDEHAGVRDRFTGAGILAPELAAKLGTCGLAGRASGQAYDLRIDLPCEPYTDLKVRPASGQDGDVAARVAVRFDELQESARFIGVCGATLPTGAHRSLFASPARAGLGLGLIEGWRGPVLVALTITADGSIQRCHPHDPSWQNWPALEHAIIGNIVPDFPLINKSFNLSYSGHDL
jgi:Ni,Fe-hydrogenase III large subunit